MEGVLEREQLSQTQGMAQTQLSTYQAKPVVSLRALLEIA